MIIFFCEYDKNFDYNLSLIHEIAKQFELNREELKILKDEKGKPYLENHPEIHISISHSINKIVYGYSEKNFGIDIEKVRDVRNFNYRFFKKVLNDKEFEFLFVNSKSFETDFMKIWTKKEAYLKYLGTGISNNLNVIDSFELNNSISFEIEGYMISIYGC
jgi:4'-phosphopantetheinyl transferase